MTLLTDNNAPNNADNQTMTTWTYAWAAGSARQTVVEKLYIDNVQMDNITTCTDNGTLRTSLQYPNGRTLAYAYDAVNRLSTIAGGGSTLAEYDYKGFYLDHRDLNAGVLRLTSDNGTALGGYDAFGRTIWMRHYKVSGGTDVVKLNYGYDYASNPLYIEDCVTSTNSELYAYDAAHRLADMKRGTLNTQKNGVTSPTFGQTWTLDKLGNWRNLADNGAQDVRQHNEVNEISLPSGGHGYPRTYGGSAREITHDAAGNVATCQSNDGTTTWRYTYDYRNQLIKAESKTTGQYAQVVTYLYDGQNKRIKKHLQTGPEVVYIYDGWRCIEEREYISNAWKAKRQFVFGGRYLDEELLFDKDTNNDGNCTDSGGSVRYLYCQNANWNVVALTDNTGTVKERYAYTPYGACTVTLDDSSGNPFRFQGKRLDAETGFYYFNNRYYRPDIGRFPQRDPIGYADGIGLYEFVKSQPTTRIDTTGLTATGGGSTTGCCGDDITDALAHLGNDLEISFNSMPYAKRTSICNGLYQNPVSGWDITPLDTGGVQRSGVGACQGTVTINGKCYEQETVNYFEFGEMIRLCGGSEMQALATVSWWKIGGYWHLPQKEALGWTRAGYHGIVSGVPSTHEGCSISKVVSPTPLKATLNPAWASYWTPPFPLQWLFPQGQPGPTLGGWTIIM